MRLNKKGFTLISVLISIIIVGFMGVVLFDQIQMSMATVLFGSRISDADLLVDEYVSIYKDGELHDIYNDPTPDLDLDFDGVDDLLLDANGKLYLDTVTVGDLVISSTVTEIPQGFTSNDINANLVDFSTYDYIINVSDSLVEIEDSNNSLVLSEPTSTIMNMEYDGNNFVFESDTFIESSLSSVAIVPRNLNNSFTINIENLSSSNFVVDLVDDIGNNLDINVSSIDKKITFTKGLTSPDTYVNVGDIPLNEINFTVTSPNGNPITERSVLIYDKNR